MGRYSLGGGTASVDRADDELLRLGDDDDIVLLHRSTTLAADAELSSVIEGTSDHLGVAANSLIMSNITNDGDIMFAVSDNGNSIGLLKLNGADGTLEVHGDTLFSNGTGVVIGHTAQITANTVAELQVLGSGAVDSSVIIGAFSADTTPAELQFVKSRNASVAGNTIVADNDLVGRLNFLPADGVDFATTAATFHAEVEDGSPAAGDIGMAFVWSTMAGGAASLTEKLRLEADGGLKFNQTSTISTGTGDLTLQPTGKLTSTVGASVWQAYLLEDSTGSGSGSMYYELDTRLDQRGVYAHRFHAPNPGFASHAGATYQLIQISDFTLTLTGTTTVESVQNMINIDPMVITDEDAVEVQYASTLRIGGAPSGAGSGPATITNAYAIWVDAGIVRLDAGAIIGNSASTNNLLDDASTGSGSTTLYIGNASVTTSSDVRLKDAIEDTKVDALGLIDQFRVVDFTWDDPSDTSEYGKNYRGTYTGMVAQETVKVAPWIINDQGGGRDCPQCMSGLACDEHGNFQVEYQHLVPTLVKAIQELRTEVRALKEV